MWGRESVNDDLLFLGLVPGDPDLIPSGTNVRLEGTLVTTDEVRIS